MKNSAIFLFSLCLGHGVNDFVAGYMLHSLPHHQLVFVSIYGVIAFGGQVPVSVIIDRFPDYRKWAMLAVAFNCVAVAMAFVSLPIAIIISGIASAIYHVSGGALSLRFEENFRGIAIGAFSAPGIIGLTIGAVLPSATMLPLLWTLPLLVSFLFVCGGNRDKEAGHLQKKKEHRVEFDAHDVLMLLILLLAAARSAMWDIFQVLNQGNIRMLIWIALAAATGKFIGGFLSSRINTIHYLNFSMLLAVILLHFAEKSQLFLLTGIALLQSGIPGSIRVLGAYFPGKPAFVSGSVLGFAVFAAAVFYYGLSVRMEWFTLFAVLMTLLLAAIHLLLKRR